MDSLEHLREDLWTRWRSAFDRIGELQAAKINRDDRKLYANSARFDLKDYRPGSFPAGGRVLNEPPKGVNFYYLYRLDEGGLPVQMSARHIVNNIDWEGICFYSDTEVEYVDFCLQNNVVNHYTRIAFHNASPIAMQHFKVNGGGSHLAGRTGKKAIEFIASSPFNYFLEVEEYDSSISRINSGRALSEGLGMPRMRSVLEYSYSDTGKLLQVTRTHDTGWKTTDYAAQTATSTGDLADRLSEKIAAKVIESLAKMDFTSPLLCVELFYRQVTNYVPYIKSCQRTRFLRESRSSRNP